MLAARQQRSAVQALHFTLVCPNTLHNFIAPAATDWGTQTTRILDVNVKFMGEPEVILHGLRITRTVGWGHCATHERNSHPYIRKWHRADDGLEKILLV